ncbi:helix-turn-helix domain-containing protein [Nocardia sp. NPDC057272]|uniref:helix-turn-helix domain-containing protein n=1 Tax=Nocardia sp. NPDC057272 TaxID=3346079 RepID=UPI0036305D54
MTAAPDPGDVKGILHPQEQARHRSLNRLGVGPALAEFADRYWVVRWDLRGRPSYSAQVLSFPCVNVTFERSTTRTGGFVTGVCTTKYVRELAGEGETFGIRFAPGGFGAFTGMDVGALRDDSAPLSAVLPEAAGLADRVLAEQSDERRRDIVEEFFAGRGRTDDPHYALVTRIVTAMATDPELTRVDQVTDRFAVPIRTLQRLFRRYVGAGPKWVLCRFRLQDAADLLAHGRPDVAVLAAQLGYFDQAHFSREFTAEIGMSPTEYARSAQAVSAVPRAR